MTVLVTGVAGFIGSTLAERLVSDGHEVIGIDNFSDYYDREIKESNISRLADVSDFTLLEGELQAAEQRFRTALEEALGHESLVLPVYTAYMRLVGIYGESPAEDVLSADELEIFSQWQAAELAATTAALGPHRYMGDAQFEIRPA